MVQEGYKSFARNSYLQNDALLGSGTHEDIKESSILAVEDFYGSHTHKVPLFHLVM
jgi:hypothetical protein